MSDRSNLDFGRRCSGGPRALPGAAARVLGALSAEAMARHRSLRSLRLSRGLRISATTPLGAILNPAVCTPARSPPRAPSRSAGEKFRAPNLERGSRIKSRLQPSRSARRIRVHADGPGQVRQILGCGRRPTLICGAYVRQPTTPPSRRIIYLDRCSARLGRRESLVLLASLNAKGAHDRLRSFMEEGSGILRKPLEDAVNRARTYQERAGSERRNPFVISFSQGATSSCSFDLVLRRMVQGEPRAAISPRD
ncbi:hypothetical protein B0H15DRAFT_33345 [Mycena belliarum]|uniref:Uncharacterized protein n=1 Tax=Mycena belliarum TaxID=1033014 RepID=A0AAD6UFT5_9AGAR|nr:hypothetical protein B0H15DRAFT_33345 [Mycena belliae]